MTDTALDPFDVVRGELRRATGRDLDRRARGRHAMRVVAIALIAVVALTGMAAAANEHVAAALRSVGGSIDDVLSGPPAKESPSAEASRLMDRMEAGISAGTQSSAPQTKVLLHATVNGFEAEMIANFRPVGSATHWGPSKEGEFCIGLVVNDHARQGMCTGQFIPGTPVNYGIGKDVEPGRGTTYYLSGIADDSVIGVDVDTDHGREPAAMGDHAFFWASDQVRPEQVIIHLSDGTHLDYAAEGLPGVTSTRSRSAPRATPHR
jgi:hypothetical protein